MVISGYNKIQAWDMTWYLQYYHHHRILRGRLIRVRALVSILQTRNITKYLRTGKLYFQADFFFHVFISKRVILT